MSAIFLIIIVKGFPELEINIIIIIYAEIVKMFYKSQFNENVNE